MPSRLTPAALILAGATLLQITCSGWTVPPPADVAGRASDRIMTALVAVETAQGDAAIARSEDPGVTVAPKWEPLWKAWRVWTASQRAWAAAYDSGAPGLAQAEEAARAAACALPAALPPDVPAVIVAVDGIVCAGLTGKDGGM